MTLMRLLSHRAITFQTALVPRPPDCPRFCSLGAHDQREWEPAGPLAFFFSNIWYSLWGLVAERALRKKKGRVFDPRLRQKFGFLLFAHVLPNKKTRVFTSHGPFFYL